MIARRQTGPGDCRLMVVVAIDLGAEQTHVVFSTAAELIAGKKIVQPLPLEEGQHGAPTTALFTDEKKFAAFGLAAQDEYARMLDTDREKAKTWYFFESLGKDLHCRKAMSRDEELVDKSGKRMRILDVLSAVIGHLKHLVVSRLEDSGVPVRDEEVTWVPTVPALWEDRDKQLVKDAAAQAGLSCDLLVLTSALEAVPLYCLHFLQDEQGKAYSSLTGKGFLLVHCGEEAVDVTAFEVTDAWCLRQIYAIQKKNCGGAAVNEAFKSFLSDLIDFDGFKFCDNLKYLELMRSWQMSRDSFQEEQPLMVKIPSGSQELFSVSINDSTFAGKVRVIRNVLRIDSSLAQSFFQKCVDGIHEAIGEALEQEGLAKLRDIVLTGELSGSRFVHDVIQKAFPEHRVLESPHSSLMVVMGAITKVISETETTAPAKTPGRVPTSTGSTASCPVLVVSIDFGTTFSGCAFSFMTDFEEDPLNVSCLNIQSGDGSAKSQAAKVPTCVLFTPDKEFAAFGKEAEDKYARMCDEDPKEAKRWYFFSRFKMMLHNQTSHFMDEMLKDDTGRNKMKAIDVFAAAIHFLKKTVLVKLYERRAALEVFDIKWVLTVPAIWDDGAKQFMREAAKKAQIPSEDLVLALEPEAASLCSLYYTQANQTAMSAPSFTQEGKRFMTVDCGGGTVDISVFEVIGQGRLKQLHRPMGAVCGGFKVDDAFLELLRRVIGNKGLVNIDKMENLEMMRNLEEAKPSMGRSEEVHIKLPSSIEEEIQRNLPSADLSGTIQITDSHLVLNKDGVTALFAESKEGIIKAMTRVLQSETVDRVDAILLVGGLSESKVIQDEVTNAFPEEEVLVPPSPSLTVLMGAVQYGHCPQVISTRVASFTYGVNITTDFVEGKHDEAKAQVIEGVKKSTEVFRVFIRINDIVSLDQQLPFKSFTPVCTGQTQMKFNIYRTRRPCPKYVTEEGCEKIGLVTVEMPDLTGDKERQIRVTMSVSGTELKVMARDGNTEKEFSTTCELLSKEKKTNTSMTRK